MLLLLSLGVSLLGIVLIVAGLMENPALLKFVAGALLIDLAGMMAAGWAATKGPGR